MCRVLIIGGDSKIGAAVAAQLSHNGCEVFTTTRNPAQVTARTSFLDLSKPLDSWQPPAVDACLLAGAITSLKDCQENPHVCEQVNVTATLQIAEKMRAQGTYVLFLSSNQVFDGSVPRVPAHMPVKPLTWYGVHKAKVETVLSGWNQSAGIVRITKVLDERNLLLQSWKSSLEKGECIQAFDDYFMAPVAMDYVAVIIAGLLQNPVAGIVQLSGDNDLSYFHTARLLAEALGNTDGVHAVSAVKNNAIAHIPAYTSLDCSRIESLTAQRGPSSVETVKQIVASMLHEKNTRSRLNTCA